MNWSQFLSFLVSMLAITNPLGSLAVFLSMTPHKSEHERRKIALDTTLTIFLVLIIITWTGIPILNLFGISLPAFEITGGLIILLHGLAMLRSKETPTSQTAGELQENISNESIAIVPLGIPIIAGPGAMTNTIIFSQEFSSTTQRIYICAGILLVSLTLGFLLFFASRLGKMIGENGIKIVTRIMGLLLSAIAMSMITTGLKNIFPGWT